MEITSIFANWFNKFTFCNHIIILQQSYINKKTQQALKEEEMNVNDCKLNRVVEPVKSFPSLAYLEVGLALNVHEDGATSKADGDHYEFGPERPLKKSILYFLSCAINEYVERPHNTSERNSVKHNCAQQLTSLKP